MMAPFTTGTMRPGPDERTGGGGAPVMSERMTSLALAPAVVVLVGAGEAAAGGMTTPQPGLVGLTVQRATLGRTELQPGSVGEAAQTARVGAPGPGLG